MYRTSNPIALIECNDFALPPSKTKYPCFNLEDLVSEMEAWFERNVSILLEDTENMNEYYYETKSQVNINVFFIRKCYNTTRNVDVIKPAMFLFTFEGEQSRDVKEIMFATFENCESKLRKTLNELTIKAAIDCNLDELSKNIQNIQVFKSNFEIEKYSDSQLTKLLNELLRVSRLSSSLYASISEKAKTT